MSPKFEIVLRRAQFKPSDKLDALELFIACFSLIKKKFECCRCSRKKVMSSSVLEIFQKILKFILKFIFLRDSYKYGFVCDGISLQPISLNIRCISSSREGL